MLKYMYFIEKEKDWADQTSEGLSEKSGEKN